MLCKQLNSCTTSITLMLACAVESPRAIAQTNISIQPLAGLAGTSGFSAGLGISHDGSAVVGAVFDNDTPLACYWIDPSSPIVLDDTGVLSIINSVATTTNADGSVIAGVVTIQSPTGPVPNAFRWTKTTGMVLLNDPNNSVWFPAITLDMDQSGTSVVGIHSTQSFIWTTANATQILAGTTPTGSTGVRRLTPDGHRVVGYARDGIFARACYWDDGVLTMLPHDPTTMGHTDAQAVSADGTVIYGDGGFWIDPQHIELRAFVWRESTGYEFLDMPRCAGTEVQEIDPIDCSADGSVVLGVMNRLTYSRIYYASTRTGAIDLTTYLSHLYPGSVAGGAESRPTGMSLDGKRIVGYAGSLQYTTQNPHGWTVSIEGADVCYADCDASGTLNIFDSICFGNAYVAIDPYADCDSNGAFNILDYLCFSGAYAAGCP